MPVLWRIAVESRTCHAHDMSGAGAAKDGGRWNSPGRAAVYASGSISLACLETLVHIRNSLPLNRYLVRVDIPDAVWAARTPLARPLPIGWDAEPHGLTSIEQGDRWLAAGATAILEVPSAIVPEESNVLINPNHPDTALIAATALRKWMYSPRLRDAGPKRSLSVGPKRSLSE